MIHNKKSDRDIKIVADMVRKHVQSHASEFPFINFLKSIPSTHETQSKLAQWYRNEAPAGEDNKESTNPPVEEGMGEEPMPDGKEIGQNTDEDLQKEVFGTQMANPLGSDVQSSVQGEVMAIKDSAVRLAKTIYNMDISEADALDIAKDTLKSIAGKLADIPVEAYIKQIKSYTDKSQDNKPTPPAGMNTPPAGMAPPNGNMALNTSTEPLLPLSEDENVENAPTEVKTSSRKGIPTHRENSLRTASLLTEYDFG